MANTQEYQKLVTSIDAFITYLAREKNVSNHTQRAYKSDMRQLARFWNMLLERAHAEDANHSSSFKAIINRYINWLQHNAIDNYSIARKISCLNSYEKFLAAREQRTPEIQIARPLLEKKTMHVITYNDITKLLNITETKELTNNFPHRDRAILELLYATGIRCSELVILQLADIDIPNQCLYIKNNGKKERVISLSFRCTERLSEYITHERIAPQSNQEFLFFNYRNQPLTTRSIQRICESFRELLQIPYPVTPHVLRNSCATHLIEQGAPISKVQEILGYTTRISAEKYLANIVQQHSPVTK